jgi:hypothetical protein
VTDPNPPISYNDLYAVISTLSIHPFRVLVLPPVFILLLSHLVEWYIVLPYRVPVLRKFLPKLRGDLRQLQPGLFSICTHLLGVDADARKPVEQGGLGYEGVLTTMQGMVTEVVEWNREHAAMDTGSGPLPKRCYTTSVSLAEQLRHVMPVGSRIVS